MTEPADQSKYEMLNNGQSKRLPYVGKPIDIKLAWVAPITITRVKDIVNPDDQALAFRLVQAARTDIQGARLDAQISELLNEYVITDNEGGFIPLLNGENNAVPIGRKASARDALKIENKGISRYHVVVMRQGDDIIVQDLFSRNGTAVPKEMIPASEKAASPENVLSQSLRMPIADTQKMNDIRRELVTTLDQFYRTKGPQDFTGVIQTALLDGKKRELELAVMKLDDDLLLPSFRTTEMQKMKENLRRGVLAAVNRGQPLTVSLAAQLLLDEARLLRGAKTPQ